MLPLSLVFAQVYVDTKVKMDLWFLIPELLIELGALILWSVVSAVIVKKHCLLVSF